MNDVKVWLSDTRVNDVMVWLSDTRVNDVKVWLSDTRVNDVMVRLSDTRVNDVTGSRPDMTFAVDWALKPIIYLSRNGETSGFERWFHDYVYF